MGIDIDASVQEIVARGFGVAMGTLTTPHGLRISYDLIKNPDKGNALALDGQEHTFIIENGEALTVVEAIAVCRLKAHELVPLPLSG